MGLGRVLEHFENAEEKRRPKKRRERCHMDLVPEKFVPIAIEVASHIFDQSRYWHDEDKALKHLSGQLLAFAVEEPGAEDAKNYFPRAMQHIRGRCSKRAEEVREREARYVAALVATELSAYVAGLLVIRVSDLSVSPLSET